MHTDDFRPITGSQLRAARALLRWSQDDLAQRSQVAGATITDAEGEDGPVSITATDVRPCDWRWRAGIEFIDENGGGVGARFAKRSGPADEGLRLDQLTSENVD